MRSSKLSSVVSMSGMRAGVVGITTVALGLVLVPPATAGEVPIVRAAAPSDCPAVVEGEALAVEVAARCGREVEVLDSRTEWTSIHALPDGQLRLDTSIAAQRTQVSGEWAEIDTALVETGEGIAPASPAVEMVFSDGSPGQPLVRMARDGHELTFDVPFEVGAPVVRGNSLEYREVLDGVDLIVTVNDDGTGFSEVLRVQSPEAAADPRLEELVFPVVVSDGLEVESADGGFDARDEAGETVFAAPAPIMWDSRADLATRSLTPRVDGLTIAKAADGSVVTEAAVRNRAARTSEPVAGDAAAVMDLEVADGAILVTPDAALIEDDEAVWPVYIDPSVSGGLSEWASVRNNGPTRYKYTGDEGVGHCGTTGSPMYCTSVFTRRAVWQFTGLQAVGNVAPGDITEAVLRVYGTHSYSCTPAWVEAWWTSGINSSSSWSSVAWYAPLSSQNVAHKSACGNARWIEFDVIGGARETAARNAAQLTLGVKAQNEGSSSGWKRYRYDASLSIKFNRAPNTPTSPYMTATSSSTSLGCGTSSSPTWVHTAKPILWATITDADGGNVMAEFDVYSGSTLVWDGGRTSARASGSKHSQQVGKALSDGTLYSWTVHAHDGSRRSGSGQRCYFQVDTVPPAAPTVQPLDPTGAGQAAYPAGQESGGVGLPGRFRFASTSSDVKEFAYSFDSTDLLSRVAVGSPVASWTPSSPGQHTLRVQAVDRSGRTSSVVTYQFAVARPGRSAWLLEEGPGATTAADSGDLGNQLPLTLRGKVSWVGGPLTDDGAGTDWALSFADTGTAGGTSTASPAVLKGQSFSVSATLRSRGRAVAATAVSQDGAKLPAFELGQVTGSRCPDGVGPCWAFSMPTSSGGVATAVFDTRVPADEWVQVTGTFDASSGKATVFVCPLWTVPEQGRQVTASGSELGVGPMRLGRSSAGGAWSGEIAEVHVYDAVIDYQEMTRTCHPAAE